LPPPRPPDCPKRLLRWERLAPGSTGGQRFRAHLPQHPNSRPRRLQSCRSRAPFHAPTAGGEGQRQICRSARSDGITPRASGCRNHRDGRLRQAGDRYTLDNQTPRRAAVASEMGHHRNRAAQRTSVSVRDEAMLNPLGRVVTFALACAFAYQSFDSLRSAILGVQPEESAPNKDPKAISARAGGVAWGIISLCLSLAGFWASLFA
jgi:hypothetical protein